jgi:acetyl-CoA C-acetyltransferase
MELKFFNARAELKMVWRCKRRMAMRDVYILSPCRTAIGSFMGALSGIPAYMLGAAVIAETLRRSGVGTADVEQVIMGNVLQAGQGQNPARQAAVYGGLPVETPAFTVNRVCGSGLLSVSLGAMMIRAGEAECVITGGMENMSAAPHYLSGSRAGVKAGDMPLTDGMLYDGLRDAFGDCPMGITAENIAEKYKITREEQDAFAFESQQKAARASAGGVFGAEITGAAVPQRRGEPIIFNKDEYIRPDTSVEKLNALKPAFKPDGTVTAGNASGINDGAAAMILVSGEFAKRNSLKAIAKYAAGASCGVEPSLMGMGPVPAARKALAKAGLDRSEIGLFELNEAFAVQAVAVCRELELPVERVNVNGGAIALGHPIGASGARIAVTLLHEMARRGTRYGLAALCVGGGMGEAAVFELWDGRY